MKEVFTQLRHAELVSASNPYTHVGKILRQAQDDRKKGFTLAEVLITLTIIGVIAALTIPNLIASYQKQQYVTQLKKVYTEISQAMKQVMADEGINKLTLSDTLYCDYENGCDLDEALQRVGNDFLKKYFKVIKDCGTEYPSPCFASKYNTINGNEGSVIPSGYSVINVGGASISIFPTQKQYSGTIYVDINGLNPPNIYGRDLFTMAFFYDGSIDEFGINPQCRKGEISVNGLGWLCNGKGNAYEARESMFEEYCDHQGYGSCFGKILNDNWKMDY
ncbi:MAG TPA: type II secretion system protein [Candidatus Gastranaerophilaceae bacterium]|nr:type II secretion system protein [Candidatus Gastranaerophilaceae bacterium]